MNVYLQLLYAFWCGLISMSLIMVFNEFSFCSGIGSVAPKGECTTNEQCADQLACIDGTCINPCSKLPCGANAYCEPENHAAWCRCTVGFKESTNGECVSGKKIHYFS
jgi:hypothetical protein